jgi:hypothetical protein
VDDGQPLVSSSQRSARRVPARTCALSQHNRALAVYYLWQSLAAGSSHKEAYTALAAYREAGNITAEDAEKDQLTITCRQFAPISCTLVSLELSILPATDYTGR